MNYNKLMEEEINNIVAEGKTPSVLLHSCCAPCSSHVIDTLTKYFDITILYYNPNIEPYEEYEKRKKEQIRLIKELNIDNLNLLDVDYENEVYRKYVEGYEKELEGGTRCHLCYKLRLMKTRDIGILNNFEYFGTTLSVSPYKNAEVLNKIGKELSENTKIKWLYSDFKKKEGYKKSIELSKKYNLYRQDYCGCLFSKTKIDA